MLRLLLVLLLSTPVWATNYDLTARTDSAKSQAGKKVDLSYLVVDTVFVDVRLETVALGVTSAATFRNTTTGGTSTNDTVIATGPTTLDTVTSTSLATLDTARVDSAGINKLSVFGANNTSVASNWQLAGTAFTGTMSQLNSAAAGGGTVSALDASDGSPADVFYFDDTGGLLTYKPGGSVGAVLKQQGASTVENYWERYSADASSAALQFSKSRHATAGSHTIVQSGDALGEIYWAGSNGTSFTSAAALKGFVDGTPGASNDMPGNLVFYTTPDGSGTLSEAMRICYQGAVTRVRQPSFLAQADAGAVLNVTGDGTAYTMVFNTEKWDQGSNFDGTSTFTAPVTGRYFVSCHVMSANPEAGHTSGSLVITTSNRNYEFYFNPYASRHTGVASYTVLAYSSVDMDAADTMTMVLTVSGGGKTLDIGSSAQIRSGVSVSLHD